MSKTLRTLMAAMLLSTTVAALAAPVATAHTCYAQDPEDACGDCDDLLPHNHRYLNGSTYCRSSPLASACEAVEVRRLVAGGRPLQTPVNLDVRDAECAEPALLGRLLA